jgi:hypothetical protein
VSSHLLAKNEAEQPVYAGFLDEADIIGGCSCEFYEKKGRKRYKTTVFTSDLNKKSAKMLLEGEILRPKLIKATLPFDYNYRVGTLIQEVYEVKNFRIVLENTVTDSCSSHKSKSDENCETVKFKTVMKIKKEGKTQKLQLFGSCGC